MTHTITLKRLALALALCASVGAAPAKSPQQAQAETQDGIQVKPLPGYRELVSSQMDQQASQQYLALLAQAKEKRALAADNHPELIRLRAIARRIIPFTTRWNPAAANWQWQVNLLGSKQVNAFCMPGGRIAFYSGIITSLNLTDDEIAAIMGHEITHALREHGAEQMVKSTGTSLALRLGGAIAGAYMGLDPRVSDTAAQYGAQMISLKFSRDDEREADLVGLDLAARAGFDPRAGISLWNKMDAMSQRQPVTILSTHPGGPERIKRIQDAMGLLLPVYARARGTTVDRLPAYRSSALPK